MISELILRRSNAILPQRPKDDSENLKNRKAEKLNASCDIPCKLRYIWHPWRMASNLRESRYPEIPRHNRRIRALFSREITGGLHPRKIDPHF